jgi:hypothetical protein
MKKFISWISEACVILKLEITIGHTVSLKNEVSIHATVFIPFLGGDKGMLIVNDYDDLEPYVSELVELGYGFSVMDEPRTDEEFKIESFIELFSEWGWHGDLAKKPVWIQLED